MAEEEFLTVRNAKLLSGEHPTFQEIISFRDIGSIDTACWVQASDTTGEEVNTGRRSPPARPGEF